VFQPLLRKRQREKISASANLKKKKEKENLSVTHLRTVNITLSYFGVRTHNFVRDLTFSQEYALCCHHTFEK